MEKMNLKKYIFMLITVAVLGIFACGCGNGGEESTKPPNKNIQENTHKEISGENSEQPETEKNYNKYEEEAALYADIEPVGIDEIREAAANEQDICAVAFLGYGDDIAGFLNKDSDYRKTAKMYPFINEISPDNYIECDEGQEIYCIVPSGDNYSMSINEWVRDETNGYYGETGNVLYRNEYAEPIILRCNSSDVVADTQVIIVDNNGNSIEFYPSLYIQDKMLVTPWYKPGIYDFTVYTFMDFIGIWKADSQCIPEGINMDVYIFDDYTFLVSCYTNDEPWGDTSGEWYIAEGYRRSDIPGNIMFYYNNGENPEDIIWGTYELTRLGNKLIAEHIGGEPFMKELEGKTIEFEFIGKY